MFGAEVVENRDPVFTKERRRVDLGKGKKLERGGVKWRAVAGLRGNFNILA